MPTLYMLVGVPGSGKSTWTASSTPVGTFVYSTDYLIEEWAEEINSTYNDCFKRFIKMATSMCNDRLNKTISQEKDIVWDQTNLTKKSRKAKLNKIPSTYKKVAVYFPTPPAEVHKVRLDRKGKTIPYHILMEMIATMEPPSYEEGFDSIILMDANNEVQFPFN